MYLVAKCGYKSLPYLWPGTSKHRSSLKVLILALHLRKNVASMQAYQAPEVLRVPLHQLCLTLRATLPPSIALPEALAGLLTPPPAQAVAGAVDSLAGMGALGEAACLTMLGRHLACMPMDPKLGKALIYGALLRSLFWLPLWATSNLLPS